MAPSRSLQSASLLLGSCLALLLLLPLEVSAAGKGLAPRLSRRRAIEDRPLVFVVHLPEGMAVGPRGRGGVVGEPGLRYRYHWQLLDSEGQMLREKLEESTRSGARWETAALVEPYSRRFREKLHLHVGVEYMNRSGQVLDRAKGRFVIPRIQDVTPPLVKSMGDEEEYPDFTCRPLTVEDGGIATTHDGLQGEDGEIRPRSPFRAIVDDGATVEGADSEGGVGRGCLEFEWANVFDNLAPPFTGNRKETIKRFGLYIIPNWDLGGSHHLVAGADRPHLAATREMVREDGEDVELHLIDLTQELGPAPEEGAAWGRGRVRIPLPYDRVGDLEVGFFAEDRAWPTPNQNRVGRFRYRVQDDISPTVVFTIRKVRERQATWISVDSVNKRWTTGESAFSLPDRFGGPPFRKAAGLSMRAQTPYSFHVMAFDNTRLDRAGMRLRLRGPEGTSGYGIQVPGQSGRIVDWSLPVDGFDPSLARSPRKEELRLFFGVPGRYRLEFEVSDVHGNRTHFELPLEAGDSDHDWIRISEESVRLSGGSGP